MRLVLYTGKGGVGKTTVAAATAVCAAARGRRTLVASSDAAHSLGDVLEHRLGPEPECIAPDLDAVEIDARVELTRHWGRLREFLVELLTHQGVDGVVAEELALLPGAEELCTLFAVEAACASGDYDLVVLDCAPTDAALRVLTLPEVAGHTLRLLLPLARTLVGVATPIARHLTELPLPESEVFRELETLVGERLAALRTRVTSEDTSARLVVTPERMVIDEARRAYTDLALFEVPCDAVVLNRVLPEAALREPLFADWGPLQRERQAALRDDFAPLPCLAAPLQEDEPTGLAALGEFGRALFDGHAPEARLAAPERVRFGSDGDRYFARLPLPGARADELDVAVVDEQLVVTTGARRRAFVLPRRMSGLPLSEARLADGALEVRFEALQAAEASSG